MIFCSKCGENTKYYDTVKRFVRTAYGKQYEKHIIDGFIFGSLTSEMLEYEDYPCPSTVRNWKLSAK